MGTQNSTQAKTVELLNKYKWQLVILIVLIIFGLIGHAFLSNYRSKEARKFGAMIHQFEQQELQSYQDKKLKPNEYVEKLLKLAAELKGHRLGISLLINSADILKKDGMNNEALRLLELAQKDFLGESPYADYFILSRLAVMYEDTGKDAQAISVLEKLLGLPVKLLEGKTYLALGRLYQKAGNVAKAQASFQYILDNVNQADFTKMARLYLEDLKASAK